MAAMATYLKISLRFFSRTDRPIDLKLVGSYGVTYRSKLAIIIRSKVQAARHCGHLYNLFFSSTTDSKGQLTRNLVGSIGAICRSKIAEIISIGNPRWRPS